MQKDGGQIRNTKNFYLVDVLTNVGVIKFGKDWKQVDEVVETRNSTQIRSHAQKYFLKFQKQQKDRKKAKNKSKVVFT